MSIHHITAIAGEPQRNLDFYTDVLGLRLVKLTVNFDDPAAYHLYFGDETGRPGSILTFFPWPDGYRGRQGTGRPGHAMDWPGSALFAEGAMVGGMPISRQENWQAT